MSEHQPISVQNASTWLFIGGGILLFLGLYVSAFLVPDVVKAASGPRAMTLPEAAEIAGTTPTYARLENGTWDCDTLIHVRRLAPAYRRYGTRRDETQSTEIFFTDDSREVVAFVTLSGEVACDDLIGEVPTGYLYAMSNDTQQELTNDARLARYFEAEHFLEFCGYCGRDNSLIGAIFGIAFTILGGAMIVYGRRLKKRSIEGQTVNVTDDLDAREIRSH